MLQKCAQCREHRFKHAVFLRLEIHAGQDPFFYFILMPKNIVLYIALELFRASRLHIFVQKVEKELSRDKDELKNYTRDEHNMFTIMRESIRLKIIFVNVFLNNNWVS